MEDDNEALSFDEGVAAYADSMDESSETEQPEALEDEYEAETGDLQNDDEEETESDDQEQPDEDEDEDQGPASIDDYQQVVQLKDGTTKTVQELINGSMAHSDYTRRVQEHSREKQEFQQFHSQVQQRESQANEALELAAQAIQQLLPEEPSLELMQEDFYTYSVQKKAYDDAVRNYQNVIHQTQQQQQNAQAEQQRKMQEVSQEMFNDAVARNPELRDRQKFQEYTNWLAGGVSNWGANPAAIATIGVDGLKIVEKAIKWDESQKRLKTPAKQKTKRPPVQRGSNRSSRNSSQAKTKRSAFNRLSQTGAMTDAVAALIASEDAES